MSVKEPSKTSTGKMRAVAFSGMTEQEENVLCSVGEPKKLSSGAMLALGDNELFLVLEGTVKITKAVNGVNLHLSSLKPGDWGGNIAGAAAKAETVAAIAEGEATVMLISDPDSGAVPASVLLKVYRRMLAENEKQIVSLAGSTGALQQKNRYLSNYTHRLRNRADEDMLQSEIVQTVLKKIPRLPVYVTKLLVMLQDKNVKASDVVECARQDPSLVTEILKIVNSAAFGFDQKITDVHQAVMLLGFNKISQLVVGLGVANTMPNTREFKELLNDSISIAHMAYVIAKLCKLKQPSLVSTVGLLHEVGESMLLLLKQEYPKMAPFFTFCDQAKIGAMMLRKWELPEAIWQAIQCQDVPAYGPPEMIPEHSRKSVAVLHLARLCDRYLQGSEEDELERGFFSDYVRFLEVPEETVMAIVNKHIVPTLRKQGSSRVFSA